MAFALFVLGGAIFLAYRSQSETEPETVFISASSVVNYTSLDALMRASDLIVVGKVTNANSEIETHPADPRAQLVTTYFTIEIESHLYGDQSAETLGIRQMGGSARDVRQELEGDPLFEVGDTYLLFMRRDPESPRFVVLGGADGRFVVNGDRALALSEVYPDRDIKDSGLGSLNLPDVERAISR